MAEPKVSVLMPTFNNSLFLVESLESILGQSFEDFEFVIVDDGSTDDTAALLGRYAKSDRRIRVLRNEKNEGIVFSLNRGLRECRGDYVLRMDSDDVALRNRLEKQVAAMEADSGICALGGALSYIDASGKELGVIRYCEIQDKNLAKTPLLHPTVIIRRKVLVENGILYNEKYRFAEDYFLWLQLNKVGRISAVNDVVVKYRLSNKATKITRLKETIWATLKVKKDAIFILKICPAPKDIIVMFLELILLLLPSRVVLFIYFKKTFGKNVRVNP